MMSIPLSVEMRNDDATDRQSRRPELGAFDVRL